MNKDKYIIRELAKKYSELACGDEQQKMNKRMKDTNDLKLVRPPVLIDEIPWYQMDIDGDLRLECENKRVRGVEEWLRKALFRRKYFKADTLFEPFYRISMMYSSSGIGIERKAETLSTEGINDIVSYSFEDLLEDEANLERIKIPTFTAYPDVDKEAFEFYSDLFGETLPVKICGIGCIYNAPWDDIIGLRGITPVLMDLYDRPEYLHDIRQRFLDILLAELDFVDKNIKVDPTSPNMHCTPSYVSGLAEDGLKATWLRTMAQGFSDISASMHEEFDIDYVLKVANRFAYTYYGCCEALDKKLDVLFKIPNLRKVGVSPWAKEETMAERLGNNYVYARKPNPAYVATVTDPEVVRKETVKTVELCKKYNCPVEFVLKDISTVSNRPENLIVWSNVVSEVLDEYYGEA